MSFRLQGSLEFQGLSIAIENKAGTERHWTDENSGESGATKLKYPYGYIKGTLGTDGDEVDVFVGPDKSADTVYIVTQMKKPKFVEIDEQKVMLGFSSAEAAKRAYLEHYNDPKFFGSMKAMPIAEFQKKVRANRGKLIKHLFLGSASANIPGVDKSSHVEKGVNMDEKSISKSCEHSKEVTCEKCSGTHSATEILKALTAKMLSMTARDRAALTAPPPIDPEISTEDVTLFGPNVARAMHRERPFEPPHVPKVTIETPPVTSPHSPDFMKSCDGCGYIHKSLSNCPRCAAVAATNREATPIWRR